MSMDASNSVESREKERDRRGRGARGSRFTDADGNGNGAGSQEVASLLATVAGNVAIAGSTFRTFHTTTVGRI